MSDMEFCLDVCPMPGKAIHITCELEPGHEDCHEATLYLGPNGEDRVVFNWEHAHELGGVERCS